MYLGSLQPWTIFQESDIRYKSDWQTMQKLSAIDATSSRYASGFYIVALASTDPMGDCGEPSEPSSVKNISFTVDYPPESETMDLGYYIVVFGYLTLLFGTVLASIYLPWPIEGNSLALLTLPKRQEETDEVDGAEMSQTPKRPTTVKVEIPQLEKIEGIYINCQIGDDDCFFSDFGEDVADSVAKVDTDGVSSARPGESRDLHSPPASSKQRASTEMTPQPLSAPKTAETADITERLVKIVTGQDPKARVVVKHKKTDMVKRRGKKAVTVDTLATICDEHLYQSKRALKSRLYAWLVLITCVFYALPAAQLMTANQATAVRHGDGDICYYNFLCRVEWLGFQDFGHVFSNISYVACGLAFIILVTCRRQKRHKKIVQEIGETSTYRDHAKVTFKVRKGVPEQYGIFYALGLALVAEGFLSATYHVCPTNESFQFDTTFMYIIAILMFLKVRHISSLPYLFYLYSTIQI